MTSWCRKTKWKLGTPALCVLATWVAVIAATYVAILVYQLEQGFSAAEPAIFLPRLMIMGLGCVGTISYIYVGFKAPRLIQVHLHGMVLMLLLAEMLSAMVAEVFQSIGDYIAHWVLDSFVYATWGARRALLVCLMTQKMRALGVAPAHHCLRIESLGFAVKIFTLVLSFGAGVPTLLWNIIMVLRGIPGAVAIEARRIGRTEGVPLLDSLVLSSLLAIAFVCTFGNLVASSAFMLVAWRSTRSALRELQQRKVTEEMLSKAQRTLWQHLTGVVASLLSNNILIVATVLDVAGLMEQGTEEQMTLLAYLFDVAGDVIGTLLLSGVGELLIHENPEAGDIGGHIRGILHAAVLTSRAEMVFEGRVIPTPERACIVSFPGKFLSDWNALTWLCDEGRLSSACVFLPTSDLQQRFGQHSENPDTPGKCWCTSLYGEVKPWGCLWFDAWRANIQKAVELQLELIVVFFPGQAGMGVVAWDDLRSTDLWSGIGLGGSQKAEVAYLRRAGHPFTAEDLEDTRRRIGSLAHENKPTRGPPTVSLGSLSSRSSSRAEMP